MRVRFSAPEKMSARSGGGNGGNCRLFLGVDVGTGSARAALFTEEGARPPSIFAEEGARLPIARRKIETWTNPGYPEGSYEQSTEDIWRAVCSAVKEVCAGGYGERVAGVGFTATCSLVAVDLLGHPVTVSPSRDPQRNVILWQDHRAVQEAAEINSLRHPVLRCVGGALSPEMQPPKLLWLKRHLHDDCWERAGHFFDLADYLTFRATGHLSRSLCCVVCKWTYIGHTPSPSEESAGLKQGWNDSFWKGVGLGDLVADGYRRIGVEIVAPGTSVGKGLTQISAEEMGLNPGIAVASSLIDAHSGGVGLLGGQWDGGDQSPGHMTSRLALIGGTSTCQMAVSSTPEYIPGVLGPYYSAMLPGYYLSEGGQSTAGQLLDYVLQSNTVLFSRLQEKALLNRSSIYKEIERALPPASPHPSLLTSHLHIVPDFHGNRSPLADPTILGMVSGQAMVETEDDLAVLYLATVQALALGTRHVMEVMNTHGHAVQVIFMCGGLRHNNLYVQATADITGLPVVLPAEEESVLLGASILASAAAGNDEVLAVMRKMCSGESKTVHPTSDPAVRLFYDKKYKVFLEMYEDQRKYATIMAC